MDRILIILCALLGLSMILLNPSEGALSILVILALSIPSVYLFRHYSEENEFLTRIFLIALLVRISFGQFIHFFDLRLVFGPDAIGFDIWGRRLMEIWQGLPVPNDEITDRAQSITNPGWGINYLVGAIYFICGPSILVAQSFCGIIGALIAPMIYFCAKNIFNNQRVAKLSAILVALFPSLIIWSSQLLKDGLIIFMLVFAMTMILQLQKKFSYAAILFLILSLFGILSLRFYIFYMVAVAVAGSFIIGLSPSVQSIIRNLIVIIIIGVGLTYLGVIRNANSDLSQYGSLEYVQRSRQYLSEAAESSFGEDLDVSTPTGAISALPIGFTYLMFAPFPWDVKKLNQLLVLPEVFIWWTLIPIMVSGLWYTLKNRLRHALPVLLFSLMLIISYSIFLGNVGIAYRQRTQIQVFLFIFIAVGWEIIQERKENKNFQRKIKQQKIRHQLQENESRM